MGLALAVSTESFGARAAPSEYPEIFGDVSRFECSRSAWRRRGHAYHSVGDEGLTLANLVGAGGATRAMVYMSTGRA